MSTNFLTPEAEIDHQVQALQSPLAVNRAAAARRLGQLKAGAESLIAALQDNHEAVRLAAAQALGNLPCDDARQNAAILDHLLSAIDDASDRVCQAAVWSIGMRHETSAADQIAELASVSNPYIAGNVILALARFGDPRAVQEILPALEHPNDYLKTQAVRAAILLRDTSSGPAILTLFRQLRVEHAQKGNPRYMLMNHVFEAIATLELSDAIPDLLEIAQKDVGFRGKAVETLIALHAEDAASQLAYLLADPSSTLRITLLHLMGRFHYLPAITSIRPLLHDQQHTIRRAALEVLLAFHDTESAATIEWMSFRDPNPFTRAAAVNALPGLRGSDALPALRTLSGDANVEVRRAALNGLLEINAWDAQTLGSAVRFVTDFPEEPLSIRLQTVLDVTPPPLGEASSEPAAVPDLDNSLPAQRDELIALLHSWLANLPPHTESSTRAAIQHLLAVLRS